MKTPNKKDEKEEKDESQSGAGDLLTENEMLKQAYDTLDKDYKALQKENEQLKKQTKPPAKAEKPEKADPKAGPGEPGIVGKLQQDKAELVAFLQLFRNRNEFKQSLYELANAKEFYWLLDKHSKPAEVPVEEPA